MEKGSKSEVEKKEGGQKTKGIAGVAIVLLMLRFRRQFHTEENQERGGVSVHTGRVSPGFSFLPGQSHCDQAVPGAGGCWDRIVRTAVLLVLAKKTCQLRIICENQEQV